MIPKGPGIQDFFGIVSLLILELSCRNLLLALVIEPQPVETVDVANGVTEIFDLFREANLILLAQFIQIALLYQERFLNRRNYLNVLFRILNTHSL